MTIFMIVAAVMLVLGFFLNGGFSDVAAYFTIIPTENYGDPSSYVGKKVLVETTFDGGTIQVSGTVIDDNGNIWADITDGYSNPMGTLYFESDRLVLGANGLSAGQELTIKVSIVEDSSGSSGGLVVHDTDGHLDKTYVEIHDAMANGSPVMVVSNGADPDVMQVLGAFWDENSKAYAVICRNNTYKASDPDDHPSSGSPK